MDLLERYLQAVGQYLPDATRVDTMAELRANLLERMDAQAEELGRALSEREIAEVLREHGKPEVVALRYLPQRSLIGPTVFPFYEFALRRALPLVVVLYAVAEAAKLLTAHGVRVSASALAGSVVGLVPALLIYGAWMTIGFAVVEEVLRRNGVPKRWMEWDPMKLPPVKVEARGVKTKSVTKRIVDLCVHCLWMAFVIAVPRHPFLVLGPGVIVLENLDKLGVGLAPVWHVFYEGLIVLLVIQLVVKLIALPAGEPAWMRPMELVTDLLGAVVVGIVAFSGETFVPVSAVADLHKLAEVNHWVGVGFRIALFFAVLGLVVNGWEYVKRVVPKQRLAF